MSKFITQSRLLEVLNYNQETGIFTWICRKSQAIKPGARAGTIKKNGYVCIKIDDYPYQAHRLAFLYMNGEMPIKHIDHINGCKSDNSWINLRIASISQNLQNQKKPHKQNITGLIGVSIHKASGKFQAQIRVNNKQIYLGLFNDKELAYKAYIKAKRELHPYSTI